MRTVNNWNSLKDDIVQAPSVNSFKNRLDKFCETIGIMYCEDPVIGNRRGDV
jgi:hypothetical protein